MNPRQNIMEGIYTKGHMNGESALNDIAQLPDSLKPARQDLPVLPKKNRLKKLTEVINGGNISLGYDYGFLPYTVNMTPPASAFSAQGQLALTLLQIPVDITFFYSTQKNLIGLNNYFRISYNADRYKSRLGNILGKNIAGYKDKLGDLLSQRQELQKKLAYQEYLLNTDPSRWPKKSLRGPATLHTPDSLTAERPDSLTHITDQDTAYPSVAKPTGSISKSDSSLPGAKNIYRRDSLQNRYNICRNQYDSITGLITTLQKTIRQYESYDKNGTSALVSDLPLLSRAQNFLAGVKRFEIGLCYPANSTFLVNNVPVRGINFEYARNNSYLAFTYGTVVSTVLYSNRSFEGALQNIRTSYNYFDFNNVTAGRKVLSAKFGVGKKEGNHLFAGFLIGKGLGSFPYQAPNETASPSFRESNLVLEVDGKYKLGRQTVIDIMAGKSSLKSGDMSYDLIREAVNEIFSPYRSNAILTRISTVVMPTRSNISIAFRWVDPFFKSYGTGFIRSDNIRYELKLDQPLSKAVRYTAAVRYEEDNLLRLLNYHNTFLSINNTLACKIKRGLMLRLVYTPLLRTLRSQDVAMSNRNSIATGVITYSPVRKKGALQFNVIYNYYNIVADTQRINFQNISYTHQVNLKNGFGTSFNASWFRNDSRSALNNNVLLSVLEAGYRNKAGSGISLAGKAACKPGQGFYPGFLLKGNIRLYKGLFTELQIEKFIVGELFNGYELASLKSFPYYGSMKLTYNF